MSPYMGRLEALTPDHDNANKGTERGDALLGESLRELGLGRSLLADKAGRIIAGNKTLQKAAEAGVQRVLMVPTDGNTLVVVQRTDLDLTTDARARKLATMDNRVGELNLDWDPEVLRRQAAEYGISLEEIGMTPEELQAMERLTRAEEAAAQAAGGGAPEDTGAAQAAGGYAVVVVAEDQNEQRRIYDQLIKMGLNCKTVNT
jgi:hypothetical protein